MLLDRDAAAKAGRELYEVNRTHWEQKRSQKAVEALVQAGLNPVR
jgi:predicted NAD-dependent protein-ADP-ribosyltransferase YbiA (DUF1768 family)